jgi:electron transfer flavoprotein alpha subunit
MTTLLLGDGAATAHALTAALRLGDEVHLLEVPANVLAEPTADFILSLAGYDAIVAPATSTGKNVLPTVAAMLDVMVISDVIEIVSPDTFKRPTYAGNAIETVQSTDARKVITVRASAFPPTPLDGIKTIAAPATDSPLSRLVSEDAQQSDRPELGSAKIVISGGRAFA